MDTNTVIVIVVAIFAVVVIAAFFAFRRVVKAGIKGPFGMSVDVDASNESSASAPGAAIKGSTSTTGGMLADDKTGRGSLIENSKAKGDIIASSAAPEEKNHPKA